MNENAIAAFYHLYLTDEPLSTADVAELVFEPEDTEALRNAERKVRYYFEDGYAHLVNATESGGSKRYSIREDRIWFGVGQIRMLTVREEEIEAGLGDMMLYMTEANEPEVVSIEYGPERDPYRDGQTDF